MSFTIRQGHVTDIPDEDLIRRAMTFRKAPRGKPRWIHVMDRFQLGRTYSRQLCERFNLDPDEGVKP